MTIHRLVSHRSAHLVWLSLLASILFTVPARAWETVAPGVEYRFVHTTSPAQRIHELRVDLHNPSIGFRATREEHLGMTTSAFGRKYGVAVAINGGFRGAATAGFGSQGLAIADGSVWASDRDDLVSYVAVGADNRIEYDRGGPAVADSALPAWYRQAVNGRPLLVWQGRNVAPADCPTSLDLCSARHPRTATGVSRNGRYFYAVVVDGRQPGMSGMTTRELAAFMIELGAWYALNHDGGGSSDLWIRGRGVMNSPSDGTERVVSNHLGIVARDPFCRGNVRGRVRMAATGEPVASAHVVIEGERRWSTTTGEDGSYAVRGVSCGVGAMTVSKDGLRSRMREVHVVPIAWTRVNPRLRETSDPAADGSEPTPEESADETTTDPTDWVEPEAEPAPDPGEPTGADAGTEHVGDSGPQVHPDGGPPTAWSSGGPDRPTAPADAGGCGAAGSGNGRSSWTAGLLVAAAALRSRRRRR